MGDQLKLLASQVGIVRCRLDDRRHHVSGSTGESRGPLRPTQGGWPRFVNRLVTGRSSGACGTSVECVAEDALKALDPLPVGRQESSRPARRLRAAVSRSVTSLCHETVMCWSAWYSSFGLPFAQDQSRHSIAGESLRVRSRLPRGRRYAGSSTECRARSLGLYGGFVQRGLLEVMPGSSIRVSRSDHRVSNPMEKHGDVNPHRPGVTYPAGSQTVLPTLKFSPATTVWLLPPLTASLDAIYR